MVFKLRITEAATAATEERDSHKQAQKARERKQDAFCVFSHPSEVETAKGR
jgi:hypothetical protein